MRRNDREVLDPQRIDEIIQSCHCCRLGLVDGDACYIVPLSFGYERNGGQYFYFHCAREGRKLDLARKNPKVSFELDCGYALREAERACGYSCAFRCVMGEGTVCELHGAAEKEAALRRILDHTAPPPRPWTFSEQALQNVAVLKLTVDTLSCKVHE